MKEKNNMYISIAITAKLFRQAPKVLKSQLGYIIRLCPFQHQAFSALRIVDHRKALGKILCH